MGQPVPVAARADMLGIGEKLPQFNRLRGNGPVASAIRTTPSVAVSGRHRLLIDKC
jgi:hypothetical protein